MVNSHSSTGKGSPSAPTHGPATHGVEQHVEALHSLNTHPLYLITAALLLLNDTLSKGLNNMANDFSGLKAALEAVEAGIRGVAAAIANPAIDNNDQLVIDGFTAQLKTAADALASATAAEQAEDGTPAPVETPVDPAPVDGSGSTDVTA